MSDAPVTTALVNVASFGTSQDAMLARTRLFAAGIDAFIPNELTLSTQDYLAPALGGHQLLVPAARAAEARALLEHPGPASNDDEGEPGERCIACDSTYVVRARSWVARAASALLFIPTSWFSEAWRCRACGHVAGELATPPASHPYRSPRRRTP